MSHQKLENGYPFVLYSPPIVPVSEMQDKADEFYELLRKRRSVRTFSDQPIPLSLMEKIILSAGTAPSGAHKQPWTFCLIGDPGVKKQIREAAEAEEKKSYTERMSEEWIKDLAPLGTDWQKPFLEIAPWLIVVFKRSFEWEKENRKHQNYYVTESVGLACGFLLAAIHQAGLASLTHTPSPMNFLSRLLQRPENEKPFLLIPVGYPSKDCWVPDIKRKELEEIRVKY